MIIEKVDPSRATFDDYSLEGPILTVGNIAVDLEAEQEDQEVIIVFSEHEGKIKRGMMPCCRYVAEAIIPPRHFEDIEAQEESAAPSESDGNEEEEHGTHTERVMLPLDLNSVRLKLWPVDSRGENEQEGELYAE